ncbi:hypothetical protein AB0A60_19875 [Streptomyces sp. NPDC046275]|uniref:hypothetical protein n=1 Tax=Streptomyces sp. NPDC046275 TaxID=3157201 RepID=UPI0033E3DDF2
MAGRVRRCAYIFCTEPLPVTSRSDKRFCSPACKQADRRWRRHQAEAVAIGLWYRLGVETEHVVRCPACGKRFALGHGHRRDAVYCRPACRQAAYRERKRVREGITATLDVTAAGTRSTPLASADTGIKMAPARTAA